MRRNLIRATVAKVLDQCDPTAVRIYGPYPPHRGRSRWRIQVYDASTGRKKSLTAASHEEAMSLVAALQQKIKEATPITTHAAIDGFAAHKASQFRNPRDVDAIAKKLKLLVSDDLPLRSLTPELAQSFYLQEANRIGKFGQVKPATHHSRLRLAKEWWRFCQQQGWVAHDPWVRVATIGRANSGKPQPTLDEARRLKEYLFAQAELQDEGALALLVQLYLGLRPSEVLGLRVGDCSDNCKLVRVNGTKTKLALRDLELAEPVAELLQRRCASLSNEDRIFATHLKRQPAPPWMLDRMHRACAQAGIRKYCAHSLRGLHSSLALRAGASTHEVARSLGHASFATTAKHYAHPTAVSAGRSAALASALDPEATKIDLAALPPEIRAIVLAALKQR